MARKRAKAAQPAPETVKEPARPASAVRLEAQAAQVPAQTTSGYVGVFPTPKPEVVKTRIEPKRDDEGEAVKFCGNGIYAMTVVKPSGTKRSEVIKFVNGEYIARGAQRIAWCRERGFPEA